LFTGNQENESAGGAGRGRKMSAREFLSKAFLLDKQIKAKREQIRYLQALKDNDIGVGDTEQMRGLIAEYSAEVERLVATKKQISAVIRLVENDTWRYVLIQRYENLMMLRDIAADLRYRAGSVRHMHCKALAQIDKIMGGEKNAGVGQ
jgi:hypothetical protein